MFPSIWLICGRFNPHLQELLRLQDAEERVHVLVDVADMWNKLALADVVVAAAGSTMYELSTIGVPTVCCYYVENQRRLAEGFAERPSAFYLLSFRVNVIVISSEVEKSSYIYLHKYLNLEL